MITQPTFAAALSKSEVLFAVRELLRIGASERHAQGSVLNAVCSALSWLTLLIQSARYDITTAIVDAGILPEVVRLYMRFVGSRSCILSSNVANVMHTIHESIHIQKSSCGSAAGGAEEGGRTGLHVSSPAHAAAHQQRVRSPFIRSLGRDDDSSSSDGGNSANDATNPLAARPVDTRLAQLVVDELGEALSRSRVAQHQQLLENMRRVLYETPEEAQEDMSSRATSATVERVVIPNEDFNALLAEYGPDAPIPEAVLAQTVGEVAAEAVRPHPHADVVASDSDDDDTEHVHAVGRSTTSPPPPPQSEESGVGFLLRRQKTIRAVTDARASRSRSRSESPKSKSKSPPSTDPEAMEDDGSVQPPPAKEARMEEPRLEACSEESEFAPPS